MCILWTSSQRSIHIQDISFDGWMAGLHFVIIFIFQSCRESGIVFSSYKCEKLPEVWGIISFFLKKKNLRQVGQRPESLLHSMCSVLRWEASWVGWLVLCVHLAGPGYPVRWSNIILDVSVEGVFGWDGHWKKADSEYSRFPSSCGRALSSQGKASIDLKICLL